MVGALVYPALMAFAFGLDLIGQTPDVFSWTNNLYGVVCLLLSPGAILMMDAEHTREILWALPFATVANVLWYAFIGTIVWYVLNWSR